MASQIEALRPGQAQQVGRRGSGASESPSPPRELVGRGRRKAESKPTPVGAGPAQPYGMSGAAAADSFSPRRELIRQGRGQVTSQPSGMGEGAADQSGKRRAAQKEPTSPAKKLLGCGRGRACGSRRKPTRAPEVVALRRGLRGGLGAAWAWISVAGRICALIGWPQMSASLPDPDRYLPCFWLDLLAFHAGPTGLPIGVLAGSWCF